MDLIHHTYLDWITGQLYRTPYELLLTELGLGSNLSSISNEVIHALATTSLVTSS
jgi:hypothetical protein